MSKSNDKNNRYEESNCEKEEIVPKIIRSFPRRSTTEKWILIVIVWVWQIFGIDSDFPTWSYQQTTPSHCKPKFTCQQSQPIESYKNQQACYCQQKIALTIKWKSVTSLLDTLYSTPPLLCNSIFCPFSMGNLDQILYPMAVLKFACRDDCKAPPTYSIWWNFGRDIWG